MNFDGGWNCEEFEGFKGSQSLYQGTQHTEDDLRLCSRHYMKNLKRRTLIAATKDLKLFPCQKAHLVGFLAHKNRSKTKLII